MDIPLLVAIILLIVTLLLFFGGLTPYPFGLIILSAFLIARLIHLTGQE